LIMNFNTINYRSRYTAGSNVVNREPEDPWISSLRDEDEPMQYVRKDP
jgi:hypothetical protein